ncbi:two-component sensor histidine kinase [Microbacterium nanhaiense]|uniref:histidine kinase n=1 Tax=Microbacterium nanhaiense TaxID=1301026 RepID=A0ABQ2N1J5_9MICO|nr:histidine kinase [Microbacterium nanhaiense]GGO63709.1 two-component sensor histidine kinase [Microbacterium nanhaiense]
MSSADPRIDFATGARLRVWSRIWRYLLVVLLSVIGWFGVYGLFAIAVDEGTAADSTQFWVLSLVDPVIWLIAMGLLPFRRRIPATVAVTASLLSAFSVMAATGPAQLAVASNATHRRWRSIIASIVTGVVAATLYNRFVPTGYVEETPWWIDVLGAAVGFALPAVFGLYIGARRALIASLHDRALEAERERELQIAAAEAGERTRIAREMHDVLAHRISLVAMHAGALAYRDDLTRDQVRGTAVLVQENSRRALAELRQVLGVLRADGAEGIEPPQPTLETLPTLIDEARAAGAVVDASGSVAGEAPELVSRTAFRIVQEALTNARKHAPGAPIRVRVDGHAGGLLAVEVTNGAARAGAAAIPGSGMGLAGLAERVELVGGTLEYGPDGKGGFAVRAWLPWEECDE